jgi:hypothetical protein
MKPILGFGRGGDVLWVGLCPRPNTEASGESEVSEIPLSEASDETGSWAGMLTWLAGGLARESLACRSL